MLNGLQLRSLTTRLTAGSSVIFQLDDGTQLQLVNYTVTQARMEKADGTEVPTEPPHLTLFLSPLPSSTNEDTSSSRQLVEPPSTESSNPTSVGTAVWDTNDGKSSGKEEPVEAVPELAQVGPAVFKADTSKPAGYGIKNADRIPNSGNKD